MHEYPPGSDWHAQKATRRYHVINRVPFLQPEIRAFFYGKYGAKVMRADFWFCIHAALQAFLADPCVPFFPGSIPVFPQSLHLKTSLYILFSRSRTRPSAKNESPPGRVVVALCIRHPGWSATAITLSIRLCSFYCPHVRTVRGKWGIGLPFFGSEDRGWRAGKVQDERRWYPPGVQPHEPPS